jgi:hypothetical protein
MIRIRKIISDVIATYQMRDGCEGAGVLDPLRLCAAAQPCAALLNLHNININSVVDRIRILLSILMPIQNPETDPDSIPSLHMLQNQDFFLLFTPVSVYTVIFLIRVIGVIIFYIWTI